MDIFAFLKNIGYTIKTSSTILDVPRKLVWIYSKGRKGKIKTFRFHFRFPEPIRDVKLFVRNNNNSDAFIISEVFLHECYKVNYNKTGNRQITILDLGANAGYTAVYFSRLFPGCRVICVEPVPGNILLLKKNLLLNKTDSYVYEAAIAINDGEIQMELGDRDYGHKVSNIEFGKKNQSGVIDVKGISIKTVMQEQNINTIDILKIDIEGYEGVLLQQNNEWLARINCVIMEIHENVNEDSIITTMKKFGLNDVSRQKDNWVFKRI